MTRTQVGQVTATFVIAVLTAALPLTGTIQAAAGVTGATIIEAKADGPGPCCRAIAEVVLLG